MLSMNIDLKVANLRSDYALLISDDLPLTRFYRLLFTDIAINIPIDYSSREGVLGGAIEIRYNHPDGGSNGKRLSPGSYKRFICIFDIDKYWTIKVK